MFTRKPAHGVDSFNLMLTFVRVNLNIINETEMIGGERQFSPSCQASPPTCVPEG